jgi:hypothetical protein
MAPAYPFCESQGEQQAAQIAEAEVPICRAAQHTVYDSERVCHSLPSVATE